MITSNNLLQMNTPIWSYRPLVPSRENPRRHALHDGSGCPHTSGVRLAPCGSFATNTCRPTACARITAEPAPNVHCSLYIVHCWFYTFSAKEKDVETGLSYFGSRYYSSDLSIWLSVDPMSDKYASLSPYVYCADNPIKLVDPNGEDIWTINEDGKITCEKNKKIDRIDVVDKDGNVIQGTEVKYGTIKRHNITINETTIDYFEINDDDLATETFENIANNTKIEWTHAKIGKEGSNRNIVGTSHSEKSTAVGDFLLKTGYTLREVNHNHPSGSAWPSGGEAGSQEGDIPHARMYKAKFPNVILNIYVNGKNPLSQRYSWYKQGYHQYDHTGLISL